MRLQHTERCTCGSLTINDVETVVMSMDTVKSVLKTLIDKEDDFAVLQELLIHIIDSKGDCKDLGKCECCGDYVMEYILEVPDGEADNG